MGNMMIKDFHGIGNESPLVDSHQDYELLHGYEKDGITLLRFTRKLKTCDEDDMAIRNDTMRLIWAYHDSDPDDVLEWHGKNRGARSIHMTSPPMTKTQEVLNAKTWDATIDKHKIPKHRDTVYWCKIIKPPVLEKKHHVIGFSPLLQDHSKANVHHIVLYECFHLLEDKIYEKYLDHEGAECYTSQMPVDWTHCLGYYAMYVVGAEHEIYPEDFGMPFGDSSAPSYFMLEMHYDNPEKKDIVDSSGLRLYYTENLRKYDGASLGFGQRSAPLLVVPPLQKQFISYSFCPSECTKQMFPKDGIKVYAVYLHAHKAGKKIHAKIIRNGKEITPIAIDDNYDFTYQQARIVGKSSEPLILKPGDELLTECFYDTTKEKTAVFGGASTQEEMCQTYILYYPRIPLVRCYTSPTLQTLFGGIGIKSLNGFDINNDKLDVVLSQSPDRRSRRKRSQIVNTEASDFWKQLKVKEPPIYSNKSAFDVLNGMPWYDKKTSLGVEKKWKEGKYEAWCTTQAGKNIQTKNYYVYPKFEELPDIPSVCEKSQLLSSSASSTYSTPVILFVNILCTFIYNFF